MPEEDGRIAIDIGDGVEVEWDREALAALPSAPGGPPPERSWKLQGGRPDWRRWDSMRVLSAAFEDGALVAFAALRPARAKGHDADEATGLIVREGAPARFEDFLLSLQLDAESRLERLNVEAYLDTESVPLRLSGDVAGRDTGEADVGALERNVLEARMNGRAGVATLDVLRPR
jgi:hypothetical protein